MRTITKIAVAIVIFALGWVVGLFAENWSWFEFSNEVSLLDVISLVITTAIGLYVAVVIQNNLENKRAEKEIIYGQFNFVEQYLSELRSEVSKEQAEGSNDIVAKIGGCRKFWSKIVTLIKEKYGIDLSKYNINPNEFIKLNQLCTSTPIIGAQDNSVIAQDGKVSYSETRRNEIYSEIDRIRMTIVDLKLLINQKS